MLIANINEQVNSILTADMHTYGLEEFEEITEVSVDEEGNVVAVVVNSVDEFIKRFKEQRAKNSVDNTRLTAS